MINVPTTNGTCASKQRLNYAVQHWKGAAVPMKVLRSLIDPVVIKRRNGKRWRIMHSFQPTKIRYHIVCANRTRAYLLLFYSR